jgi:hypothetical protein
MKDYRENLNKIDFILKSKFKSVNISEVREIKGDPKIYFLVENNDGLRCKIILEKTNLLSDKIPFKYFSNPDERNSFLVERESGVSEFGDVISDIFENRRFDSDYLKNK